SALAWRFIQRTAEIGYAKAKAEGAKTGQKIVEGIKENPRVATVGGAVVAGAATGGLLMGPVLGAIGFSSIGPDRWPLASNPLELRVHSSAHARALQWEVLASQLFYHLSLEQEQQLQAEPLRPRLEHHPTILKVKAKTKVKKRKLTMMTTT
ncbi:hypothetical protein PG985_005736, partial [Apiospora marii]|uniref:uncharacterized protein n=1 Tax=Apiospora marii TaxID=335849 RepID=UPI00312CCAB8